MSSRRASVAAAAAAIVTFVTACAKPAPVEHAVPADAPALQVAVLGDSLAFGTGAGDTSGGFAFRIYRALAATRPGSEITNVAIGGSTATDVLRLQTRRLRERRFDVVIVCVGGNDVVRSTPAATFARTYRELVQVIRRMAPRAALVAIGVPDVSISPLFADHAAAISRLSRADDRAAHAAARSVDAAYVDLFDLTRAAHDNAGFLSQDRFHPSDEGHARIAAYALPYVLAALRKSDKHVATR